MGVALEMVVVACEGMRVVSHTSTFGGGEAFVCVWGGGAWGTSNLEPLEALLSLPLAGHSAASKLATCLYIVCHGLGCTRTPNICPVCASGAAVGSGANAIPYGLRLVIAPTPTQQQPQHLLSRHVLAVSRQ